MAHGSSMGKSFDFGNFLESVRREKAAGEVDDRSISVTGSQVYKLCRNTEEPKLDLEAPLAGRYALKRLLGKGGMGMVFDAVDLETNTAVAVKVMDKGVSQDETKALLECVHSGIVRYIDFVPDEYHPAMVMERVSGGSLAERLEKGPPIPQSEATRLLATLLQSLVYLETRGVMHQDLKPANILLVETADGLITKLADFGLARQQAYIDQRSGSGTPLWAAPEVLARMGKLSAQHAKEFAEYPLSAQVDLYGFGLVAFVTYTGHLPFAADDWDARCTWSPDVTRAIGIPRDLQPLVFRCLSPIPGSRPRSFMEMLATWDEEGRYPTTEDFWLFLGRPALIPAGRRVVRNAIMALRAGQYEHRGACIVITGPPKSGRSRLLAEISAAALIERGARATNITSFLRAVGAKLTKEAHDREANFDRTSVKSAVDILVMDDADEAQPEQIEAARAWLDQGGSLLAAGRTVPAFVAKHPHLVRLEAPAFNQDEAMELLSGVFGELADLGGDAKALTQAANGRAGLATVVLRALLNRGAVERTDDLQWIIDWERLDDAVLACSEECGEYQAMLDALPEGNQRCLGVLALARTAVLASTLARLAECEPAANLPGVVPTGEKLVLEHAFLAALLRETPPASLNLVEEARFIETTDSESAFWLFLRAGARDDAARLGVWLLQDTWDFELAAGHTTEIVAAMEKHGLWRTARERAEGHLANFYELYEDRRAIPEIDESLRIAKSEAEALGDPVLEAWVMVAQSLRKWDEGMLEKVQRSIEVAKELGDATLALNGETARMIIEMRTVRYPEAARRFVRIATSCEPGKVRLRGMRLALQVLAFLSELSEEDESRLEAFMARLGKWIKRRRLPRLETYSQTVQTSLAASHKQFVRVQEATRDLAMKASRFKMPMVRNAMRDRAMVANAMIGNVTIGKRYANAMLRDIAAKDSARRGDRLAILAEVQRIEGNLGAATRNITAAESIVSATRLAFTQIQRELILTDVGLYNVASLELMTRKPYADYIQGFAAYALARCCLRMGELPQAAHWANQSLMIAAKLAMAGDLIYNALGVAARITAAQYRNTGKPHYREEALAYLAKIPFECGRYIPLRGIVETNVSSDFSFAKNRLLQVASFSLTMGMYTYALEAYIALAAATEEKVYENQCLRLVQMICNDLTGQYKESFLATWRSLCP